MASKRPHSYPLEFRNKVIELVRSGRKPDDLAVEFKLARQTIHNWIKSDDLNAGRRNDGITSDERAELTKLRKENKQLRVEREILSKAAAWFAQETNVVGKKSTDS